MKVTSPRSPAAHEMALLQERLDLLRKEHQGTLRALDSIIIESGELRRANAAAMNLLEDLEEEKRRSLDAQSALLNILEDIEEERSEIERTRASLEAVNRELEAFSYTVSHDLRAPLRAISGFSRAIVEDCSEALDEDGKRYLEMIQENVHRMGILIDGLLEFSRIGRQRMSTSDMDMDAMFDEVFHEIMAQEPERDVKFIHDPMPPLNGDALMFRQVLVNLLSNAVKFTRGREEAVIEVGYAADVGGGAYYVRDNGTGFDMRYADKLFGVFERLHLAEEFEGSGVGLALVERIIARHGGRVWATSVLGEGATFFFTTSGVKMA